MAIQTKKTHGAPRQAAALYAAIQRACNRMRNIRKLHDDCEIGPGEHRERLDRQINLLCDVSEDIMAEVWKSPRVRKLEEA